MRFIVKTTRIVHETFDDEVVIIDLDSGSYYSLSTAGAEIWSLIEQGSTRAEMTAHIQQRYSGSPEEIDAGNKRFLRNLMAENLVAMTHEETPEVAAPTAAPPPDASALPPFTEPQLCKYTDMQELLLIDVIHDVDESGWPSTAGNVTVESGAH